MEHENLDSSARIFVEVAINQKIKSALAIEVKIESNLIKNLPINGRKGFYGSGWAQGHSRS